MVWNNKPLCFFSLKTVTVASLNCKSKEKKNNWWGLLYSSEKRIKSWLGNECRWSVKFPEVIENSVSILSDGGLGMAMFSLGKFCRCFSFSCISCMKKNPTNPFHQLFCRSIHVITGPSDYLWLQEGIISHGRKISSRTIPHGCALNLIWTKRNTAQSGYCTGT